MGALMSRTILSSLFLGPLQQELVKELSVNMKVHQKAVTCLYVYLPHVTTLPIHSIGPPPSVCHLFL